MDKQLLTTIKYMISISVHINHLTNSDVIALKNDILVMEPYIWEIDGKKRNSKQQQKTCSNMIFWTLVLKRLISNA